MLTALFLPAVVVAALGAGQDRAPAVAEQHSWVPNAFSKLFRPDKPDTNRPHVFVQILPSDALPVVLPDTTRSEIVCGMLMMPPAQMDQKIVKAPPADVKYSIRRVPAPACGRGRK